MSDDMIVETVRQQLSESKSPSCEQVEHLLRVIDSLESERNRERELVIQARLDQNTYRALIAAHQALAASHVRDSAEHHQTEEALQASEERFRTIFAGAAIGITLADLTGRIMESNPAFQQLLGYGGDELRGMHFSELTHPDDVQGDLCLAKQLMAGQRDQYQIEKRYIRKDGQVVWACLTMSLIRNTAGEPRFAIGMIEDITMRKRMEEGLRFLAQASKLLASSLDYETTLQHVVRLAVPFLADGFFVDLFETELSLRRLVLAHRDPSKEKTLRKLQTRYSMDVHQINPVLKVVQTGRSELIPNVPDALLEDVSQDGEHLKSLRALGFASAMIVPLRARERMLGTIIFVTEDIGHRYGSTDLALAEELATHIAFAMDNALLYQQVQQALQARDEFLAIAAHELKAPLVPLHGATDLLQSYLTPELPGREREQRALRVLTEATGRLDVLIDTLSELARILSGRFKLEYQLLDLRILVEQIVAEVELTLERHTLHLQKPADAVIIRGDAVRLERVIHNLLQNAIKYSPKGGPILVRLDHQSDQAVLSVTDKGIGIPDADQPHLFERFYRASNVDPIQLTGFGIGLYLVKEIITRHGGTIEVCSREGIGSTFKVWLPLYMAEAFPEEMHHTGAPSAASDLMDRSR
jgi:PAS domain S-box-containing protein